MEVLILARHRGFKPLAFGSVAIENAEESALFTTRSYRIMSLNTTLNEPILRKNTYLIKPYRDG